MVNIGKRPKCRECTECLKVLGIRTHKTTERKGWYCGQCNMVYLNNGIKVGLKSLFIGLREIRAEVNKEKPSTKTKKQ